MDSYIVPRVLLDRVGAYLADRPYREVAGLLAELSDGIKPHDPAPVALPRTKGSRATKANDAPLIAPR